MEPNSFFVKISGKANIDKPLELGSGYKIVLDGEVVSSTNSNNQNGTYDVSFMFKPALASIENEYGEIQKSKDMRSYSTILRRAIYKMYESDAGETDDEAVYERTMQYILGNLGWIYEKAKTK